VDVAAQGNFAVDLLEKFQSLAAGMFLGGVSDNFALQVIEHGKEGHRAVGVVIVAFGCGYALCPAADPVDCAEAPGSGFSRHNRAPLLVLED